VKKTFSLKPQAKPFLFCSSKEKETLLKKNFSFLKFPRLIKEKRKV
jgi:hypothetical protein